MIRPPIKNYGGKYYLSSWIIEHFPENYQEMIYCEPFCAGASVFLNKEPSKEEVISDIDRGIVSIFKALRDEPEEFIRRIKKVKYTENTFNRALRKSETSLPDYVDKAINEYVLRRMSRGGLKKTFAWTDRMRGGKPGEVNAWETMYKQLPLIANRLKETNILNTCFSDVVKVWDDAGTLTYLDPPSLPSQQSSYLQDYEMSVDDHVDLINFAKSARGNIIISGHASPLYNRHLSEWNCVKKPNSPSKPKKDQRIDLLWFNY